MPRSPSFIVAAIAAGWAAATASAQVYDFSFTPAASGLAGTANFGASTSGTLIGDWDETNNPGGTRTKPGAFGPFGSLENLPVPVSLGTDIGGNINTQTTGGFRASLDTALGSIQISDYSADFLSSGPISLPATISLLFDTFRTRSPDSLYIGGFPLEIPFGSLDLTTLSANQNAPAALGTLDPLGGNAYAFNAIVPVELNASFSFLGDPLTLDAIPLAIAITGQLTLDGDSASLSSLTPIGFAQSFEPGTALPQFPLPLPTILPPGGTAGLLFDLTLNNISAELDTTFAASATGVLVPSPAPVAMFGVALIGASTRRRSPVR
ncbi:MAG: hypothetical protein ACTS3F_15080 [Phycisphaerales bacterium]